MGSALISTPSGFALRNKTHCQDKEAEINRPKEKEKEFFSNLIPFLLCAYFSILMLLLFCGLGLPSQWCNPERYKMSRVGG